MGMGLFGINILGSHECGTILLGVTGWLLVLLAALGLMFLCLYSPFTLKVGKQISAIHKDVARRLGDVAGMGKLYKELLTIGWMPNFIKTVFVLHGGLNDDSLSDLSDSLPVSLSDVSEDHPPGDGRIDSNLFLGYVQQSELRYPLVAWQPVPRYFDMCTKVVGANLPDVGNRDRLYIPSRFWFASHLCDSFVSILGMALSNPEGILRNVCSLFSSVSRFFVSPVHLDRIDRVDKQEYDTANFYKWLSLIPPVLFFLLSTFVTCFGWWRARHARQRRDVWIAVICLYVGFPMSVWSGMILTNRLGI